VLLALDVGNTNITAGVSPAGVSSANGASPRPGISSRALAAN